MKKRIREIINNQEFVTSISVPLFFSGLISIMDISMPSQNILWNIDWSTLIKTFGICIYSTIFPNIIIELFYKDFSEEKNKKYLFLLILAIVCFLLLVIALVQKENYLIVISSLASILLLIVSSYCFYL